MLGSCINMKFEDETLVFKALFLRLQVQLREYVFDSRHRPTFGEEDVINMFPVVKHLTLSGTEAAGLLQRARVLIHQGEKQIQLTVHKKS